MLLYIAVINLFLFFIFGDEIFILLDLGHILKLLINNTGPLKYSCKIMIRGDCGTLFGMCFWPGREFSVFEKVDTRLLILEEGCFTSPLGW